jgi:signal transduction histidine kinase
MDDSSEFSARVAVEAKRLRSEFLRGLAHELRSPLNAINGFAEILQRREIEPGSQQYREFVGYIVDGAQALETLIDNVIDLANVEAGCLAIEPERFALAGVIEERVARFSAAAAAKSLHLDCEVAAGINEVELDRRRFKQVLDNFMSNAIKFTPDGGHITVRAVSEGDAAFRLEVEDTGKGVAPEEIERVFAAFGRLPGDKPRRRAGARLGLALTKALVEAQGGCVGVRSELGRGSLFFAQLPRRASADASADASTDEFRLQSSELVKGGS